MLSHSVAAELFGAVKNCYGTAQNYSELLGPARVGLGLSGWFKSCSSLLGPAQVFSELLRSVRAGFGLVEPIQNYSELLLIAPASISLELLRPI